MLLNQQLRPSHWPYSLAVALALVTFPLIWVGGLVTTYDAGMAVPDWPGTFGYNLLAYPWQTWLAGPWDLFIEHGHRMLGASAGILAIALVATTWRTRQPRWIKDATLVALGLVVLQGVLGGARVLFDERLVAMVHGCVGPLFFAYLAALVVLLSRQTRDCTSQSTSTTSRLARAAWITAGLCYLQLVLGALIRHVPLAASPQVFRAGLLLHLVVAAALVVQILLTAWQGWSARAAGKAYVLSAILLPLLVVVQVLLGIGTYVGNYAWPAWLGDYQFAASHVIRQRSLSQSLVTTAHVATGSLLLFVSVFLATRASVAGWHTASLPGRSSASLGRAAA